MRVCFETFGCRLNRAEALQMEAEYLSRGWELTTDHSRADLFVVRGCSVTARAQHDCEKLIARLRRHHPTVPVLVCGCLKDQAATGGARTAAARRPLPTRVAVGPTPLPTRTARAYLKVQDGCSGNCTFCIVPSFRGASKSVDFSETLDTAKRFVEAGYREIVVTGCNLALYASQGKRLPDLVQALSQVDAACRIRLGSVEPGPCALETIHAMAGAKNVCRFLHLPIQSGSLRVLKAMRRPYTIRDIDEAVETATRLMPGLGLGCDLMTGFPDESDLDFLATKGLLKRHPFSNAHVFPYSERQGTLAVAFPNAVPAEIRSRRAHELSQTVGRMRRKFARSFVGKTVEIVVEDAGKCRGWTSEYLPCEAIGVSSRKALVRVRVTKADHGLLTGPLVIAGRGD
ncbi:MAG: MiaB/RimO family radical SAM methylthiotransferase [Kiritimatiellia bacterium]